MARLGLSLQRFISRGRGDDGIESSGLFSPRPVAARGLDEGGRACAVAGRGEKFLVTSTDETSSMFSDKNYIQSRRIFVNAFPIIPVFPFP